MKSKEIVTLASTLTNRIYLGLLPKVSLAKWSYLQLSYCVILYIKVLELVHNVAIVLFRWKTYVVSGYVVDSVTIC